MILLLDIGNSRIKQAVWDGKQLQAGEPQDHRGDPAAALKALDWPAVQAVWVSQVTGAGQQQRLADAITACCGVAPHFACSQAAYRGLCNAYREPLRLGADRWLAMVAAWNLYGGPLVVADAGTALTVDCVDAQGRHLGGLIAPGLMTMQGAVLGATRFATRELDLTYHGGLGGDTEACVRQGAFLACLGVIDRAVQAVGGRARKIVTGGDAPLLLPHLGAGWEHRPGLVLEGLLALALA